jgi:hypothetical protein
LSATATQQPYLLLDLFLSGEAYHTGEVPGSIPCAANQTHSDISNLLGRPQYLYPENVGYSQDTDRSPAAINLGASFERSSLLADDDALHRRVVDDDELVSLGTCAPAD